MGALVLLAVFIGVASAGIIGGHGTHGGLHKGIFDVVKKGYFGTDVVIPDEDFSRGHIAKVSYVQTPIVSTKLVKQAVISYVTKPVKSISFVSKPIVKIISTPVIAEISGDSHKIIYRFGSGWKYGGLRKGYLW